MVETVASMDAMASMDWWRRVSSIALVMVMVLRASLTLESQSITCVNDLLLLTSWASAKIGEFLKRDAQKSTVPRVTDGSRSPRRVDKIDGERVEGLLTTGWLRLAPMAPMASMVWMAQDGADVEVPLVPLVVASNGVEWWLGSSTQGALTWKSLCVPSGDGGAHRCCLFFFDRQQTTNCFRPVVVIAIFVTVAV